MKLKSYTLLFRLFSFLSDKTNGASFFVKYKLLLGTLIMGLVSVSASKSKKDVMHYIQIEEKPLTEQTTCYDSIVVKSNSGIINIKGTVIEKSGEPLANVSVIVKNSTKGILTDLEGRFTLLNVSPKDSLVFSYIGFQSQTISVSQIKENKAIILEEEEVILCYEVVVVEAKPYFRNSITCYAVSTVDKSEEAYFFPKLNYLYTELQTPPISPVGNLDEFKKWVERSIIYNKQMRKDKVQGQLILYFIIDENGNIVDRKILSKLSPDADAEALRVLSTSDKWTPGMQNGKTIKTIISIPVNF